MHLALTLNPFEDTDLLYAQQLGVEWIVAEVPSWDRDTLAAARNRVAQAGLTLAVLAPLPDSLVSDALSPEPSGREAVDRLCHIVSDVAAAGIPVMSYRLPLSGPRRAAARAPGRGQSQRAVYPVTDGVSPVVGEARERLWEALARVLGRVVPAAEDAGVRLAYQTDLAIASLPPEVRILDSVAELDRLLETSA